MTFLILRDRTGLAQVVVKNGIAVPPEETTVEVVGTATANTQAPGGIEVTDPAIRLLGEPADTPAAELWRPGLDVGLPTLLDHAATTWRHPAQRAKWELAAASLHGFRSSLDATGFTEVHSPKLVESATESGSNVFEVDYFGRPAYLAQSPQFYKQVLVGIFERVYEVGPVFRAEPHDTVRHLAEYVSLDVQNGFIEDHREVIACLRDVVAGMVASIHERAGTAVERLGIDVPVVPDEFPNLHFRDALSMRAPRPTSPTSLRRTNAHSVSGRRRRTAATSSSSRATRPPTGRSTATLTRPSALVSLLRPDLPGTRAGQRRPAPASLRRLRRDAQGPRLPASPLRVVRRHLPSRHPASRRLRDRSGALGRPARRAPTSARSPCSPVTCIGWRPHPPRCCFAGLLTLNKAPAAHPASTAPR